MFCPQLIEGVRALDLRSHAMRDHKTNPADSMIEGIQVLPLRQFSDERGHVYRMLRATDPHFLKFGEIYFSTVYPGVVKAWKNHHHATVNYACVFGRIRMVLYDARTNSRTQGRLMELFMGPGQYSLVVVPPGVWNGFQGLSEPISILANCATEPYDPGEFDRLDPDTSQIPYTWPSRSLGGR